MYARRRNQTGDDIVSKFRHRIPSSLIEQVLGVMAFTLIVYIVFRIR